MKKTIFLLYLLFLSLITILPIKQAKANPDWLTGWSSRVEIQINSGDIDSNLTSFPILLYLSNSSSGIYDEDVSFIFDEVGSNSKKIALTVGETSETYVEIERWDSGNEQAWLWANVTATASSNQSLYLYYDNSHADNNAFVGDINSAEGSNVWNDFVGVYHMRDKDANEIYDSTSSSLDGTKRANNEPNEVNGKIDKSQDFDGVNDYIDIGTYPSFNNVTFEAWFKADVTSGTHKMIHLREVNQQLDSIASYIFNNRLYLYWRTDGATVAPNIAFTDTSSYHQIVGVRNATTTFGYLDGSYNSGLDGTVGAGTIQDLTASIIGSDFDIDEAWFNGIIDEIRFSSVARSASWIKASYESANDNLLYWIVPKSYLTIYFTNGGILRRDNATMTNGTELSYANNTLVAFELVAIVEGNMTYGFNNFTWDSSYNISNPYDFNETITGNLTLWTYFEPITAGAGSFSVGIGAGLVLGLTFMIIIFVVALKKKRS